MNIFSVPFAIEKQFGVWCLPRKAFVVEIPDSLVNMRIVYSPKKGASYSNSLVEFLFRILTSGIKVNVIQESIETKRIGTGSNK